MDRSATDYAYSLAGEHAMNVDRLRRKARELRAEAQQLEDQADREAQRVEWAEALAAAMTEEDSQ